jgi:transposase
MSREGMLTGMEVEGAIDGDAFFVFLRQCLGPCLRPGDVVLMDNLSTHKSARMSEAIRAHGAEVVFLPRYSPDCNPIEGAWSKLKAYLRKVAPRTPKALDRALTRGLARIKARDARGWFKHAGYKPM